MRAFISINLPDSIKNNILDSQAYLPESGAKISLVAKDQLHLTLKFLGNVAPPIIDLIQKKLRGIKVKKFSLQLCRVGFFPNANNVRVIWVGLSPEQDLIELQKKIDSALIKNFEKESHYVPHITMARVRSIQDQALFSAKLKNLTVQSIKFDVYSFSLMESTLTTEGLVYRENNKFDLSKV
jgi:RNA 2',3'-cyclic 3'-phosphodiesterase